MISIYKSGALTLCLWTAHTASAITVVISGGDATGNTEIANFLNANFSNVNEVRTGDFANFSSTATQDALNGTGTFAGSAAADLVIFGRLTTSSAYQNDVAAGFNDLTTPVVSFTSFVTRSTTDRLGWTGGNVLAQSNALSATAGDETTITTAGAALFGIAEGTVDWHDSAGNSFNAAGSGSVGDGEILATIGGGAGILAARWNAGDLSGTGDTFGGERLLFNLDPNAATDTTFASLSSAGETALITALEDVSGLTAIPEPSSMLLCSLGALGLLRRQRR